MTAWGEFTKQEMYGREMGLFSEYGTPDGELDMQGKSVLDIGGGPVSMTLRRINAGTLTVADPCPWPPSVHRRYKNYGIEFIQARGEDLLGGRTSRRPRPRACTTRFGSTTCFSTSRTRPKC